MRHGVRVKKLNRTTAHKNLMLKNLAASVIQYEEVKTTEAKAKAVVPFIERIISTAKKDTIASKRNVESMLPTKLAARKVTEVLIGRYKDRNSGFTSMVRLPRRMGDNSRMVKISLVEEVESTLKKSESKKKK